MILLRLALATPFYLVAALFKWAAEVLVGAPIPFAPPRDVYDTAPQSWNDLGLAALDLFATEADARGLALEPEVVETRLDIEGRAVHITFRRQLPTENVADMRRALESPFPLTPRLAAEEAAKQQHRTIAHLTGSR